MSEIKAPLVCLFGEMKTGKTSAALAAYPTGLGIGVPDNLRLLWHNTLSLPPGDLYVQEPPVRALESRNDNGVDVYGLLDLLDGIEQMAPEDRPPALIIDDFGKIVESTFSVYDSSPKAMAKSGNHDNFYAGKQVAPMIDKLCEQARHLGVAVVAILHEKPAKYDMTGAWQKGIADLPWRAMARDLEAWFDISVRVCGDEDSLDPWFRRSFFHRPYDKNWITGDRSEVCWENTPGSLYEVLRAAGASVRRFPGLEWQDDVADEAAALLAGVTNRLDVQKILAAEGKTWHIDGRNRKHVRWAVQDGIARMQIQRRQTADLFAFAPEPTGTAAKVGSSGKLPS